MKTLSERIAAIGMDENATVYRLTVGDAMVVIQDNTTAEQLAAFTDEQLESAIVAISNGYQFAEWAETAKAALSVYAEDNGLNLIGQLVGQRSDSFETWTYVRHDVPWSETEFEDGDSK